MEDRGFRENPERGLFATRDIDNELFNQLAPSIMRFRADGTDPICLYIDSLGGSVLEAVRILDLIKAPTQNGHVPRLISVVIGYAASAAADLLALSDYAIAYPKAALYYHGTRDNRDELTVETVTKIEEQIRELNEDFAMRLAGKMFHRLVVRMVQIKREETPGALFHETIADPGSFITKIRDRLSEGQRKLIDHSRERQEKVRKIIDFIEKKGLLSKIDKEAELLKAIVDFDISDGMTEDLDFNVIREDFYLFQGYFHERYGGNLTGIIKSRGEHFLTPEERNDYDRIKSTDKNAREKFLVQKVSSKLHPIWFFVVSLCRCLQEGEHPLSVTDAYWLGLIDEVVGSQLPSLRQAAEAEAQ